jgi:cytidylate kinase
MAVITISRQYGSGGNEIAARVCEILEYRYFDKLLMAQLATEVGLSPDEVVDFSEDNYKVRSFLERLFSRRGSRGLAHVSTWTTDSMGARKEVVEDLDEAKSIALVEGVIQAAHKLGNIVIMGRGGQAILKGKPDVLHVRIEAPLDDRDLRIHEQQKVSLGAAQDIVVNHDRAAADYLRRFYDIDWANPEHYDLVLNTHKLGIEGVVQLIVNAVSYLP